MITVYRSKEICQALARFILLMQSHKVEKYTDHGTGAVYELSGNKISVTYTHKGEKNV